MVAIYLELLSRLMTLLSKTLLDLASLSPPRGRRGRACGPCTQAFLSHELSRWAAAGSFGGGEARCAHGDTEHSHPRPCVTLRACLATASR